jgi:hypothetical protein
MCDTKAKLETKYKKLRKADSGKYLEARSYGLMETLFDTNTEENHEKLQSRQPTSRKRVEAGTSQI